MKNLLTAILIVSFFFALKPPASAHQVNFNTQSAPVVTASDQIEPNAGNW